MPFEQGSRRRGFQSAGCIAGKRFHRVRLLGFREGDVPKGFMIVPPPGGLVGRETGPRASDDLGKPLADMARFAEPAVIERGLKFDDQGIGGYWEPDLVVRAGRVVRESGEQEHSELSSQWRGRSDRA